MRHMSATLDKINKDVVPLLICCYEVTQAVIHGHQLTITRKAHVAFTHMRNRNKEEPQTLLSLSLLHFYENFIVYYRSDITTFLVYKTSLSFWHFFQNPTNNSDWKEIPKIPFWTPRRNIMKNF